jgi:hypothetical protein
MVAINVKGNYNMYKNGNVKGQVNGENALLDDERQRCEIWTRVMGYHRPVSSFNVGKKSEFQERAFFSEGGVAS